MKRIGLIGGVSPESTVLYYRLLNAAAREAMGGDHSANLMIFSLDFGKIHKLYDAEDWAGFKAEVVGAGHALTAAGCELLAIGSNTTNMAADDVQAAVGVPVISLFEALVVALRARSATRPLLLGTPFVMEGPYYRQKLAEEFDMPTTVPSPGDRREVDRVIFEELVNGQFLDTSRDAYLEIIARGVADGADSVILGCTEIGLLIGQHHTDLPVFDTTRLHAAAIAQAALTGETPHR